MPYALGMDIQWEEPQKAYRTRRFAQYGAVAEELARNAGRWALVLETESQGTANSLAHRIRTGYGVWSIGRFEAVSRKTDEGTIKVHARFLD